MTDQKTDLVTRAETALSGLSLREPDFDALAQRIEGAVGSPPVDDPALLAAPLPAMPEEGEVAVLAAPARESIPSPSPRDSGVIVRSADSTGPTLSVNPASFDELDDAWASRPDSDALRYSCGRRVWSMMPTRPGRPPAGACSTQIVRVGLPSTFMRPARVLPPEFSPPRRAVAIAFCSARLRRSAKRPDGAARAS